MGCLGVEFVQFQGLLLEASGDLFYQFSLRELTLSGPYRFKPNQPLAVFSLTVEVEDVAKVTGICASESFRSRNRTYLELTRHP